MHRETAGGGKPRMDTQAKAHTVRALHLFTSAPCVVSCRLSRIISFPFLLSPFSRRLLPHMRGIREPSPSVPLPLPLLPLPYSGIPRQPVREGAVGVSARSRHANLGSRYVPENGGTSGAAMGGRTGFETETKRPSRMRAPVERPRDESHEVAPPPARTASAAAETQRRATHHAHGREGNERQRKPMSNQQMIACEATERQHA